MSEKSLLSVAEIARRIGVPESTVHYWKNRFAQHIPSVGQGRQKRFKSEAVAVFTAISEMLKDGHTAKDVMDRLAKDYPLTAQAVPEGAPRPALAAGQALDPAMKLAAAMGMEMAKSLGEGLRRALGPAPDPGLSGEIERLSSENQELRDKMGVLEAEMVRLRKDRRDMERYLIDKMKGMTT
ncbi:MAG: MerR family transcriptional regulator [Desulfovibrionaceae bacterium]|nr:MerR family transcriptional regulator [Desulfovibrionaceae bacterium]